MFLSSGINREGFTSAHGRFLVHGEDRIEGSRLRDMFLPRISREGQKALRDSFDFVRCQLKHYGVEVDEKKSRGNGTVFLKAALEAGKCDQVPSHIAELEKQMHAEWLNQQSPEDLSNQPEWIMQKYFLSDGQPDRTKTTTVVGVPLDRYSEYRSGNIIKAVKNIANLNHKKAIGPKTQVIFIGWNKKAVEKAAAQHPAQETKQLQVERKKQEDADKKREKERKKLHTDYLKNRPKVKGGATPVGSYIVDSDYIESQWPKVADDLNIDIHRTDTSGVFQADFDFGVVEGVMFFSFEDDKLDKYCARAKRNAQSGDYDSMDEEESGKETSDDDIIPTTENTKKGTKRSAPTSQTAKKTKKPKTAKNKPLNYFLQLKCRETGEGEIAYQATHGIIMFENKSLTTFKGMADFSHVGKGVSFFARKVSDEPYPSGHDWTDYSEQQYETERVNRW
ncbi:hypothetical protein N7456_003988 [Penicillium angulare]|uniref:Uncharacterized protein n=1 Tax=Penicillium angulare TaxID=116970 RepID=A0A9W9FVV1_9EURO|nr:hypothetical protein N7456_003988 [Penicillium angulare]